MLAVVVGRGSASRQRTRSWSAVIPATRISSSSIAVTTAAAASAHYRHLAPRPYSTAGRNRDNPGPLSSSSPTTTNGNTSIKVSAEQGRGASSGSSGDPSYDPSSSSSSSLLEPLTDEYLRIVLPRRGKYKPISPPWPSLLAPPSPSGQSSFLETGRWEDDDDHGDLRLSEQEQLEQEQERERRARNRQKQRLREVIKSHRRRHQPQSASTSSPAITTNDSLTGHSITGNNGQRPNILHRRDRRVPRHPHASDVIVQLLSRGDDEEAGRILREIIQQDDAETTSTTKTETASAIGGEKSATRGGGGGGGVGPKVIFHKAYLDAAIRALNRLGRGGGGAGHEAEAATAKSESLEWLTYWHSFGISEYLPPAVSRQLKPLVDRVMNDDRLAYDTIYMERLLMISAEKGFLPALASSLWRHNSWLTHPERSFPFLSELVTTFGRSVASSRPPGRAHLPRSESARLKARMAAQAAHRRSLIEHAAKLRNIHLTAVLEAGHVNSGKAIYEAGVQVGVKWTEATQAMLARRLQQHQQGTRKVAEIDDVAAEYAATGVMAGEDLLRTAREAARGTLASATTFARLLDALEAGRRKSLVKRLEEKYISSSGSRVSFWWLTQIVRLQARREHSNAVTVYAQRFQWIGLPFERPDTFASNASRRLYPSRQIVSRILISLLDLEPDLDLPRLLDLHAQLVSRSTTLPPSLHPDTITHLTFVRCAARRLGPKEAEAFCVALETERGVDVGVQAWSVVAVAWAKKRRANDVWRILERLRQDPRNVASGEIEAVESAYARLKGVDRAYLGAATTLVRKKETNKATKILQAMPGAQANRRGAEAAGEDVGLAATDKDVEHVRRAMTGSLGV